MSGPIDTSNSWIKELSNKSETLHAVGCCEGMEEEIDANGINHDLEELDLTSSHLPDLADVEFPAGLKVGFSLVPWLGALELAVCGANVAEGVLLQGLDLTTNRLRELDTKILALTGRIKSNPAIHSCTSMQWCPLGICSTVPCSRTKHPYSRICIS